MVRPRHRGVPKIQGCGRTLPSESGFTLIELCVVVVVIGILVTIAVPNVKSAADRARRASCVSNQRHLVAQSTLYAIDARIADATIGSGDLFDNGYCSERLCECPASTFLDHDDYEITIAEGVVSSIECLIEPDDHAWTP